MDTNYREESEPSAAPPEAERNPREEALRESQQVTAHGEVVVGRAAADGSLIPSPSRSAGTFIDLLEDGNLSADMHHELQELAAQMRAVANSTGGKAKGSATLKLTLELEGDAFKIQGDIKVKAPDLPRKRSIMWQDDSGSFTRFPPNQTQMFGAPIRRVG